MCGKFCSEQSAVLTSIRFYYSRKMSTLISTNFAIDEDAETIRHVDEIRTNSDEIIFIRAITMLHEKLIDIMDLMNRCYSFQVYTIALLLTLFPTTHKYTL